MMDTQTVEPGCYVDSWWGQYQSARVVMIAHSLGWRDWDETDDSPGELLTIAYWMLHSMGAAPQEGSREWAELDLLTSQVERIEDRHGWDRGEAPLILDDAAYEEVTYWLDSQPFTPEGHYWGHLEGGGWGLWPYDREGDE